MNRRTLLRGSVAGLSVPASFALAGLPTNQAAAQTTAATPSPAAESGYAAVNGLNMYYEIHGAGDPLVMLHGGLATIEFNGALMSVLAQTRQVIAIEQQGHGRTADIDRPLTYEQMVEDTAAFIQGLGLQSPDVLGHSMGGATALGLAFTYPELVRKLVILSGNYRTEGLRPENIEGQRSMSAEGLTGTPLEDAYLAVAPNPEDFPNLVEKVSSLIDSFQGWSDADLQSIQAPTLIMLGDTDAIRLDHAINLLRLRGGDVNGDFVGVPASRLAVIPGATHFSMVTRPDLLTPFITEYLDAEMPEG
jgi:pimeloyl-ACP methyl ester carboxylesterase